jgi:hypothetical protein
MALLMFASGEAKRRDPRHVLLLNPFDHAFSPWSDVAATFRAEPVKRSPGPIDAYEVLIDTERFIDGQEEAPFIEYLHALLSKRKLIAPPRHDQRPVHP